MKTVVADVMGTAEPQHIQDMFYQYAAPHCPAEVAKIIFVEPSAGVVFGLQLTSGQKVVLKVFNRHIKLDYLTAMNRIQHLFYQEQFPAPAVLSPLFSFGERYAGFYELIEGSRANGHQAVVRTELARGLARFSAIVDQYAFAPLQTFMQESMTQGLWPIPHNSLFDFENTHQGAEWIDEKGKQAKLILAASTREKRLAHTDWGVKNAIFKRNKLVGVFDWDALGTMTEAEMVGSAAAQFTADWDSDLEIAPTAAEARLFVKAYEQFRGRVFSVDEYRVVSAAADYVIALIARFEHASGDVEERPYQDLLRVCGDKSFLYCD
jgi:hypothetical protein